MFDKKDNKSCEENTDSNKGGVYKKQKELKKEDYQCPAVVKLFLNTIGLFGQNDNLLDQKKAYAFVDGSYNHATDTYGWGGVLIYDNRVYTTCGAGSNNCDMESAVGELYGVIEIIKLACGINLEALTILFDYIEIENWANGKVVASNPYSKSYRDFIQDCNIKIDFQKIPSHTGIVGNDMADSLARWACGLN